MKVTCGFTIPITLYGLPPTLENIYKVMGEIKDAGFKTMEMEIVAGEQDYVDNWKKVINRSREVKLDIVSIMAVTYDMFSLNKEKREKSLEQFGVICRMTAEIGAKLMTNCFYLPPELKPKVKTELYHGGPPLSIDIPEKFQWSDLRKIVIEQLSRSSDIASKSKLNFAMEIRAGDFISSVDGLISIFKDTQKDNIGVIYDVAHLHAIKEYLDLGIMKMKDYIRLVHLSDNDGTQAYHYQPGKGNIDFKNIIGTLKRIGYDGYVVVDISSVNNIMSEAVKMKNMLEDLIAKNN